MSDEDTIHDVAIVGAGPAGSSVAAFLAMRGVRPLLLDKATFPRDKVCGDGLTPQAIYWLDRLGCVEEVLALSKSCIRECDLYINGEYLLTGRFPVDTKYPDFCILLDRRRFDNVLLENAVARGTHFLPGTKVTGVRVEPDAAVLDVTAPGGKKRSIRARVVLGADGVSSIVSRSIGNELKAGATAVSVRAYFQGVTHDRSQIKVYFDEEYFPGYGWLFVDDDGFANVGLGYAYDPNFPIPIDLKGSFARFLATDLKPLLADAKQCGTLSGGASSFYRPASIVSDRVLLLGDAANQADPLNGGGIHKAMESAHAGAAAVLQALEKGDFSRDSLKLYEQLWENEYELDRRTGELLLSIAKNPGMKGICISLLKGIGRLTETDQRFKDFAAGVFSGVIAQSSAVSPAALLSAMPGDMQSWLSLVGAGGQGMTLAPVELAAEAARGALSFTAAMAENPLENIDWGLEIMTKAVRLADYRMRTAFDGRGNNGTPIQHA